MLIRVRSIFVFGGRASESRASQAFQADLEKTVKIMNDFSAFFQPC